MAMPTQDELSQFTADSHDEERREFSVHWITVLGPALFCVLTFFVLITAVLVFFKMAPQTPDQMRSVISLAAVGLFLASAGGVIQALVTMSTTSLTVYADRVVWSTGWFARVRLTTMIKQLVGCDFSQTAFERMLNCGTVLIDTKGVDGIVARKIANAPEAVKIILYLQRHEGSNLDADAS